MKKHEDKRKQNPALIPLVKLTRTAIKAILEGNTAPVSGEGAGAKVEINTSEARILVDLFYTLQDVRKRLANQLKAATIGIDTSATTEFTDYMLAQATVMENNVEHFLGYFAEAHPMGKWFSACHGIGPVLSAGILAHFGSRDLPPTVGHWWRYAGLDPTQRWEKPDVIRDMWDKLDGDEDMRVRILSKTLGRDPETVLRDATTNFKTGEVRKLTKTTAIKSLSRIPFNRPLKTLCWKVGDQFVKLGDRQDAFYAKYYRNRKAEEIVRNERGDRAELARKTLIKNPNHAQKEVYKEGRLPDGRVDLMARRATVKLFLSHVHELWWRAEKAQLPPRPFSISIQGHAHYIEPPYQHVFGWH